MIELVIKPTVPAELLDENTKYLCQPHRPLRHRRPAGRHRPHRPEDHRRHLRRQRSPRRRRLLRQGPHQGGPLRRLRRPLGGQERRGRRPGQAAARCSWPTPSAWPSPSPCWWRPSAPARSADDEAGGGRPARSLTCAPPPSSATWTCASPSTSQLAAYGHMGREDLGVTWEQTDRAAQLQAACH